MGVIALVLLLVAEILLSVLLARRSIAQHFALYQTPPVLMGFIGQIAFALFPLLRHRQAIPTEDP
jgi:hypothetical protein